MLNVFARALLRLGHVFAQAPELARLRDVARNRGIADQARFKRALKQSLKRSATACFALVVRQFNQHRLRLSCRERPTQMR